MAKGLVEALAALGSTIKELLHSKRASATGLGLGAIVSTGDWRSDIAVALIVISYTFAQTYLDSKKAVP